MTPSGKEESLHGERRRSLRITLRQLAVFEAIARCGSISRACDEIALSPSAASMALRDLEAHVGVELFVREGRRLIMTSQGRQLQQRAASLLRQAEELENLSHDAPLSGQLRIGATPTLAQSILPEACTRFLALHPGVSIDLAVKSSQEVINGVRRMSLDLGFVGGPANRFDIEVREWLDDPLAVFCAPTHPLARSVGAPLSAFLDEDWALERSASSERWCLTAEALKHLGSLNIIFESDCIEAIKSAVRAGQLIGCLSRRSIRGEVARGELVDLQVPDLQVQRVSSIIWKKVDYKGLTQQAFLDFLAGAYGGLAPIRPNGPAVQAVSAGR